VAYRVVTSRAARGPLGFQPLAWLGGLLVLYLTVPVAAFAARLAQPGDHGFGVPGLWPAAWISVQSATISTLIVTALGIPLASWLARSRGPAARVTGVLVQLPLALPPVMAGIMLIYLVGPYTWLGQLFNGNLTGTVAGVVIAQTFVAGPFLIIAARAAFEAVDPALDDLAASLGHRPLARFWLVSLRAAAPGIRAGMLMTWLRAIGEYGATVLLAYHPYSLPVFTYVLFSSTGIPQTQAPTAIALGGAAIVLLLAQVRLPARPGRAPALPDPVPPATATPTPVSFDVDMRVGSFRLTVKHEAVSHRIAILGPSGAGKSMTLRAVAGLLGPRAGEVRYGGEPVSAVPVERRHIGYVPQSLALFPGRTVWRQAVFATDADPGLAAWWLATLRLDGLANRLPGELSGGQRQRVALARALARGPRLVLLDEPFNALDAPVRDELRRELRRLQREAGLSTVLVTHDPEEAALLADEILVIDEGRLLQAGPRSEVFNRPASPQVARLLGIQNISAATVAAAGTIIADGMRIAAGTGELPVGAAVLWSIRPDHVAVSGCGPAPAQPPDARQHALPPAGRADCPAGDSGGPAQGPARSAAGGSGGPLAQGPARREGGHPGQGGHPGPGGLHAHPAVVDDIADVGSLTMLTVRLGGSGPWLRVRTTQALELEPGDPCVVTLEPCWITLWQAPAP
jgi:ABC-type Fe3+/spermidine/putrescine transport system ATPase subunit/ABC-type sulfate transport system permease component